MRTKLGIILLLLTAFVAACNGQSVPDALQDPDWCYRFDFTTSGYNASVSSGTWTNGVGFQTSAGELSIQYTHDQIVEPGVVIAHFTTANALNSAFSTTLNLFGISETYSDTIPFDIEMELPLAPDQPGLGSVYANVDITSDADITVDWMEVRGFNPNPFDRNDCQNQPTPEPTDQPLPTITPSPTNTPTNTPTPTPTETIESGDGWCYRYDFAESDHGWYGKSYAGYQTIPQYDSVNGYWYALDTYNNDDRLPIEVGIPVQPDAMTRILGISAVFSSDAGANASFFFNQDAPNSASNYDDGMQSVIWYGDVWLDYLGVYVHNTFSGGTYTRIHSVTLQGIGTNPWGADNCYEQTPTPTPEITPEITPEVTDEPTATPTATQTYEEQCYFQNYSFNDGTNDWITNGSAVPGALKVTNGQFFEQNINVEAGTYYFTLYADLVDPSQSGSLTFDYTITDPGLGTVSDSFTPLTTEQIIESGLTGTYQTELTLASGIHTFDVFADLTNIQSARVLSICLSDFDPTNNSDDPGNPDDSNPDETLIDDGGTWETCDDDITPPSNLTLVGAWTRFLWNRQNQIITCEVVPPLEDMVGTIRDYTQWSADFSLGLVDFLQDLIGLLSGGLSNVFALLANLFDFLISGILSFFAWAAEITSKLLSIIRLYFALAGQYLAIWGNLIVAIFYAWFSVSPVAPPGLPDCVAAPHDYSLCALYWTAENTVLAGTIGTLIIPTAIIYIDLLIFMYFIGRVKNIVRRIVGMFKS